MPNQKLPVKSKILYKELSYQIVGALFDTFKSIGGNYQEKYCQRAVAKFLEQRGIKYKREIPFNIIVEGEKIGHHFLDFLIDDEIVLEIKKGNILEFQI